MGNQNLPVLPFQYGDAHNFVFLAEAGAGKSEVSVNVALYLASLEEKPVHFFDLDMTKPLFRSRDLASFLTDQGVIVHYEEQFYDAPTVSGGVSRLLRDENCYTVLDVGGDYIGARSIGGYAPFLNKPDTIVWYVVNPYRPWSMDLPHIDAVLSQVLGVSHVQLDRLRFLGNPNLGPDTSPEDVAEGINSIREMIEAFKPVDFYTVREEIAPEVEALFPGKIFPIRLYLTYEWV